MGMIGDACAKLEGIQKQRDSEYAAYRAYLAQTDEIYKEVEKLRAVGTIEAAKKALELKTTMDNIFKKSMAHLTQVESHRLEMQKVAAALKQYLLDKTKKLLEKVNVNKEVLAGCDAIAALPAIGVGG